MLFLSWRKGDEGWEIRDGRGLNIARQQNL
jgi:hypothetical protein